MSLVRSRSEHFVRARHGAGFGASGLWRMFLLLAFVVQCNLVQTHVHFAQLTVSTGIASTQIATGQPQELSQPGEPDASDYCPLCWEAAMAGHYYLPAPAVLPVVEALPLWIAGFAPAEFDLARPPHGWRSRAPPQ